MAAAVAGASVVVVRPTAAHSAAACGAGRSGSLGGLAKGFSKLAEPRAILSCHLFLARSEGSYGGRLGLIQSAVGSCNERLWSSEIQPDPNKEA